ncbi:ASCH domain-containing protein [Psychroserpens sp. NJDZ02]|uniref:ASCH domain-containing protein n=1 Tax=Psychroserpens sp. NJDZ02 TaxID=2570561 RepID=UPI0010A84445|nr:ASCH domain-containing protein [Psychroserpens sp. NJDZ02]QCE40044.1 ASCH domain-containing protein [Psychroserpens sp. NJDZ02]
MKQLTIVLFLIFISCKDKSKTKTNSEIETEKEVQMDTENELDESVYEMWSDFKKSNPEFKKEALPNTEFFDNSEEDYHRFADLIVDGKKKASSGLYIWYKEVNVDLPKKGTKLIVTDYNGKARAIIETKKVDTMPFNQITKDYAQLDMGTNIKPLENWKKAHWEFFANTLDENGQKATDKVLVVCEWFETIWPKKY